MSQLLREPTEIETFTAVIAGYVIGPLIAKAEPTDSMDKLVDVSVQYAERIIARIVNGE